MDSLWDELRSQRSIVIPTTIFKTWQISNTFLSFSVKKNPIDYSVDLFPKCKGDRSDLLYRVWFDFVVIFLNIIYFTSVKLVPNIATRLGGIFYYIDLPNGQIVMYRNVNGGISTRSSRQSNLLWKGTEYSWFLWVFSKQHFPKYQVPGVLKHQREAFYIYGFCK